MSRASAGVGLLKALSSRGLGRPRLVIIDGNKGFRAAVEKNWPGIEVQRCMVHKLRNLERHVPRHALEEVKSDYHRIINAESFEQGSKAYRDFVAKWEKLAPKVGLSLEEAGEELFTVFLTANGNRFAPLAERSGSGALNVRVDHQWSDPDATDRRLARPQASFSVKGRMRG